MGTGVVEKTVKYYLAGSRIAAVEKNGVLAQIIYDQNGRPFMFRAEEPEAASMVTEYRYKYYYYFFNAQNDATAMMKRRHSIILRADTTTRGWGGLLMLMDMSLQGRV